MCVLSKSFQQHYKEGITIPSHGAGHWGVRCPGLHSWGLRKSRYEPGSRAWVLSHGLQLMLVHCNSVSYHSMIRERLPRRLCWRGEKRCSRWSEPPLQRFKCSQLTLKCTGWGARKHEVSVLAIMIVIVSYKYENHTLIAWFESGQRIWVGISLKICKWPVSTWKMLSIIGHQEMQIKTTMMYPFTPAVPKDRL